MPKPLSEALAIRTKFSAWLENLQFLFGFAFLLLAHFHLKVDKSSQKKLQLKGGRNGGKV